MIAMAKTPHKRRPADPEPPPLLEAVQPDGVFERWVPLLLVFALAIVVYIPTWHNGLVSWDDDIYLYTNPQLTHPKGFLDIWTNYKKTRYAAEGQKDTPHQYYPLTLTLMYVEHHVFHWLKGSNPAIFDEKMEAPRFHAVSMVWHGVNAVLLILLLRRLGLNTWAAWVVAALFAVTPMNVATVAWAAEQKNIFVLFFYMLALMCYLRHRRKGGWVGYVGMALLFQCALWSKTVAVTFPIVLFFTDRLLERRWSLNSIFRSAWRVAPMLLLAVIAALITVHTEDRDRDVPLVSYQRPFVAAASLWFHALKLLVPINQVPIYQHWNPDPQHYQPWHPAAHLEWWVSIAGCLVVLWALFHWRKKIPPHFLWGLGFYVVTQLPMMGWKNINFFQFAFVADHYVYHGCMGVYLMVAVALDGLRKKVTDPQVGTRVMTGLVCAALAAYGVKTFRYCQVWKSVETFWLTTLAENPGCWAGWYNLGNQSNREWLALRKTAKTEQDRQRADQAADQAIEYYQHAIQAKEDLVPAYKQLLSILSFRNRNKELMDYAGRFERYDPFLSYRYRGNARVQERQWEEAKGFLEKAARYAPSKEERCELFERAGKCAIQLSRWEEAIRSFQQVLTFCPQGTYGTHIGLGAAYYSLGQLDTAAVHFRKALEFQPGDSQANAYLELIRRGEKPPPAPP
jgi:Flp pilus assembly protein TadD